MADIAKLQVRAAFYYKAFQSRQSRPEPAVIALYNPRYLALLIIHIPNKQLSDMGKLFWLCHNGINNILTAVII